MRENKDWAKGQAYPDTIVGRQVEAYEALRILQDRNIELEKENWKLRDKIDMMNRAAHVREAYGSVGR